MDKMLEELLMNFAVAVGASTEVEPHLATYVALIRAQVLLDAAAITQQVREELRA